MRSHRKRNQKRILKLFILQLLLAAAVFLSGRALFILISQEQAKLNYPPDTHFVQEETGLLPSGNEASVTPSNAVINTSLSSDIPIDGLASRNAVLVSLADAKILYDKEGNEKIYPASLTKIMTAIVAIENLKDLNQSIVLSSDMFEKLYREDASMAGFLPREAVPAIDLLYGALLPSGAECCIGLAEYISGSEEAYVALMNEKAEALGMKHTHFSNSTGLHAEDHYTSAEDLAVLLEYSLRNDTFREIFTSKKHNTGSTNLHPGGISFDSTLFKNMASSEFEGGSILGGKTGYTSEAGLCLASLAEKNGKEYILVTAGAEGDHSTEQFNILDALYVYKHLD